MKRERPILFSAPMVRAILDGRKTQTRRVAKPRFDDRKPCEHWKGENHDGDATMYRHCSHGSEGLGCPYGQPGDRLWVRETWFSSNPKTPSRVRYAADDLIRLEDGLFARAVCNPPKWRPSLFMPRWASRITLEIVAVRVERLQDISEKDALAEGCEREFKADGSTVWGAGLVEAVENYKTLWDSINAKRGVGWDINPWVWVIEFKRFTT
jgi:hypothetical protein